MIIYLIRNTITGKGYVGQTIRTLQQRWRGHLDSAYYRNSAFPIHSAIRRYGRENFEVSILAESNDLAELNRLETLFIKEKGTLSPDGYNLTSGGDGKVYCAQSREKMRRSRQLRVTTPETRTKLSAALIGNTRAAGMKHKPEILEQMRQRMMGNTRSKGQTLSAETRAKMSAAGKGKTISPEARQKMSAARKRAWDSGRYQGSRIYKEIDIQCNQ